MLPLTNVLGRKLDDIISVFSPEAAVKRRHFRDTYYGAYEATAPTRKDLGFGVDGRAEQLNESARHTILRRARQAERNSDVVNAMIMSLQNNVVGSKLNMQADSPSTSFNECIETLFHEWEHSENCDVTEAQSLTEMVRMAVARFVVDGGVLAYYTIDKTAKVPLKIQMREVDEIVPTTLPNVNDKGNIICNGVEMTPYGKPVAYYIRKFDPNGLSDELLPERVSAKNIDFIWLRQRPSQFREMSEMARSIVRINDIDDYSNAVSFKAKVDACTSAFIESDNYNNVPGRQASKNSENKITELAGGSVKYLRPGERLKTFVTSGQAAEFENFIVTQLRVFASSHGLSLESASRNVERVNYSSARQNMLADQQTYKVLRNFIIEHFLRKMYKRFVNACWIAGLLDGTDFDANNADFYKAKWLTEGLPWIDPLKEASANTIQLANGGMTFQDYCSNNGNDWKEQIDRMAEVKEYAESKGVKLNFITQDITETESDNNDRTGKDDTEDSKA